MTPKALKRTMAIKERLRQWRRAELLEAESRVVDAQRDVEQVVERHDDTAALITRGGELRPHDLVFASDQLAVTQLALKRARGELSAREAEREERKGEVGEATREVRAIEALHTRLVTEQKRAADKREQSELDEAAATKSRIKR